MLRLDALIVDVRESGRDEKIILPERSFINKFEIDDELFR